MNNKPLNNTTPTFNNKVVVSGNKVVSKEKIRYKYIAFDKNGKQIKGYFDAFRKSDVESFLTVQGYKIAEIKPTKITKIGKPKTNIRVKNARAIPLDAIPLKSLTKEKSSSLKPV